MISEVLRNEKEQGVFFGRSNGRVVDKTGKEYYSFIP